MRSDTVHALHGSIVDKLMHCLCRAFASTSRQHSQAVNRPHASHVGQFKSPAAGMLDCVAWVVGCL